MAKLKDLSMNQLKDKAIEAGMPKESVSAFNSKAQLIAVIEGMKSKPKLIDPAKAAEETPVEKRKADRAWESKRDRMGRHLEKQPKVGMMIPCEVGEKAGVVESKVVDGIRVFNHITGGVKPKTINGYTWLMPKGKMTQVPQQVFELVSRELNILASLGEKHSLDRVDPETGKPVREAL